MAKTIIHFIFDLGRGGAETMLVRVIRELEEYNNIVVTLAEQNHFEGELKCSRLICLNLRSALDVPRVVFKLKKIIKNEKPAFVHSHLILPTMIARIATPRKVQLVTTIHNSVGSSIDYKRWYIKFLDKLTYKLKKSSIIVVSKVAYQEYFSVLKLKPYKSHVLHTFVDTNKFKQDAIQRNISPVFKVIAVGALSVQKNFSFLIKAFSLLKQENIELHIYGKGDKELELKQLITETGVKVVLKGQVNNIQEIIPEYDLFVMASIFEGFSLSVLEAMAIGRPLLLSDIPSFREQCEGCAYYFDLNNIHDFVRKLKYCRDHKEELKGKAKQAHQRVRNNFTFAHHISGLRAVYLETLNDKT